MGRLFSGSLMAALPGEVTLRHPGHLGQSPVCIQVTHLLRRGLQGNFSGPYSSTAGSAIGVEG